MHNQEFTPFEEKVRQATCFPEPDAAFTAELWEQVAALDNLRHPIPANPRQGLPPVFAHRLHPGFAFALVLLLVVTLLFITPAGNTLAQGIWRFFNPSTSDYFVVPTSAPLVWVDQTTGTPQTLAASPTPLPGLAFAGKCGDTSSPSCSVEQIRSMVDFKVKELDHIPTPMFFVGATGKPEQIFLAYDTPDKSGGLALFEQPWKGETQLTPFDIGASARVETVQVGAVSGEYVKGSFTYVDGETEGHWDPNADFQALRWVDGNIFYQLSNFGRQLDKAELIALGANLTEAPVSANLPPVATPTSDPYAVDFTQLYPLSIAEAEEQAGFKLLLPARLPQNLTFLGAAYEADTQVVKILYNWENYSEGNMDGLMLMEQLVPAGSGEYYLGPFIISDKLELEKHASGLVVGSFEVTPVGTLNGQFSEGVWEGTDCCGWVWTPEHYKRLRWQKDGLAFELSHVGTQLSKEDLLSIAQDLQ